MQNHAVQHDPEAKQSRFGLWKGNSEFVKCEAETMQVEVNSSSGREHTAGFLESERKVHVGQREFVECDIEDLIRERKHLPLGLNEFPRGEIQPRFFQSLELDFHADDFI